MAGVVCASIESRFSRIITEREALHEFLNRLPSRINNPYGRVGRALKPSLRYCGHISVPYAAFRTETVLRFITKTRFEKSPTIGIADMMLYRRKITRKF